MPDAVTVRSSRLAAAAGVVMIIVFPSAVRADGLVIDKIYHPYVDALTTELEYRSVFQDEQRDLVTPSQIHQFAIGRSIGTKMFGEIYAVGFKNRNRSLDLESLEAELQWQLTEQGEYSADWGLMFEYENELDRHAQEMTTGILSEKEFGRWSGTANLMLIYEWGSDIKDEFESVLALQARYRMSPGFEPGIELYSGQNARGIGPVIQGDLRTGIRKKLHWEAGAIFGIESKSPETTYRFLLEYEF